MRTDSGRKSSIKKKFSFRTASAHHPGRQGRFPIMAAMSCPQDGCGWEVTSSTFILRTCANGDDRSCARSSSRVRDSVGVNRVAIDLKELDRAQKPSPLIALRLERAQ
jgi:hypothetical protein